MWALVWEPWGCRVGAGVGADVGSRLWHCRAHLTLGALLVDSYHMVGKGRQVNLADVSGFFAKLSQGAAAQLKSRDLHRLCTLLPLDRRTSLLLSGFGFYLLNSINMHIVLVTAHATALLSLLELYTFLTGMPVALLSLAVFLRIYIRKVFLRICPRTRAPRSLRLLLRA